MKSKVVVHFDSPLQDMNLCSPEGRDCIEKKSAEPFNCSMTCDGIYADINRKVAEMEDGIDKEKYEEMKSEYLNFKKEHVKQFRFCSSSSSSMFGEQILL